jgi:hypothetical protein
LGPADEVDDDLIAEIAAQLEALQETDVEASAKGLLHLILSLGEAALNEAQLHQVYVVRNRLGWR